jgi:hypothetical protein
MPSPFSEIELIDSPDQTVELDVVEDNDTEIFVLEGSTTELLELISPGAQVAVGITGSDNTPQSVGATSFAGTDNEASRSDHVHAHGNQAGGLLHAVATSSTAGFISSGDKTKLNGIAAGAEVNVNADWNASSGDAQILNKPTLGTAAAAATTDFAPAAEGVTNGNSHDHSGGDGAQIAYSSLSGTPTLGGAAALNVGTTAGTVAAGDDARFTTDLSYDAATRVLASSTGTDATLPLVTSTTPGLQPARGNGTIAYAAEVTLDFAALNGQFNTMTLTGALSLLASNLADGLELQLLLIPGASERTLTFPVDWKFLSPKPASIPANKECLLSFRSNSNTNAEVRVIALVQP